ncbi:uncharacterized protein LOC121414270 isoform X1 [Lytechinus variegatus]|uniref:uncharacterized protein LOC121414270 isoform X1 n=2 Tax=Lytechinus variegatus TaxID=7654 RepID=UPI001BB28A0F|nr:uncharacterized protein LOC121414270 isoform X1 [Lytechinus variegatus]
MSSEFVVSAEKRDDVAKKLLQIQDVFGVRVLCGETEGGRSGDSGCVLPVDAAELEPELPVCADSSISAAPAWVQVVGSSKQACEKAKEYILSLCSDKRIEETYPRQTLDMLDGRIPQLEYDSGAVIERLPGDKLRIQGQDENILRALSLISGNTNGEVHNSENGAIHERREPSRTITAMSRTDFSDSRHSPREDEVAERLRPIGVANGSPREIPSQELQTKAVPSSSSVTSSSTSSKTNSQSKHEDIISLMLKLGYSRQIVEQVLQQVGDQASSDEVLRMLVNLGSPKITEDGGSDAKEVDIGSGKKDFSDGVQESEETDSDPYRPIIIDGSNVAMSYGNSNVFNCKGIHTVVMWFLLRGHNTIYVFVPSWRKEQSKPETPIKDQEILMDLEKSKILVWTPSRRVKGRRMVCYDDRYILNLAHELDGIVVSNDTFRDLCAEKPEYRKVVEERLLMYSFAGDKFMPPDDPLGRHGPNLDNFLRKTPSKPSHQMQLCPYGKKCTYGNKCKYSHPERSRNVKTTSEILVEKDRQRQEQKLKANLMARALKTEVPEMPWEKENGRGTTDPLPYQSGSRGLAMSHGGATQQHSGAVTLPLRNPPMPDKTMNTVPLVGPQHVQQYRMHPQNLQSINEGWLPSDERVHDGWPSSEHRIPAASYHPHQAMARPQHRNQQLPNRSSMTAPISGYTPHPQPMREMMTAPLSTVDYYQQHATQQSEKRYSLPIGGVDQQRPQKQPQQQQQVRPPQRVSNNMTEFSKEFHQMSLLDTSSHGSAFDEERHYSYPLTTPYRGSPVLNTQTPANAYLDDEGYFSPITPKEVGIPSPGIPSHPSSSRYPQHPNTDSTLHPHRFMYPSTIPTTSYTNPPHQVPGSGSDALRHGGHLGMHPNQIFNPVESPRRTSEPLPPRQVWGGGGSEHSDTSRTVESGESRMRMATSRQLPS